MDKCAELRRGQTTQTRAQSGRPV